MTRTTMSLTIGALALCAATLASQGQPPQNPPPGQPAQVQPPAPTPPGTQPPRPPQPQPFVPIAANTLAANPDAYLGRNVSLTAAVDQRFGSTAFTVDQDKMKSGGQDVLVLAPLLNAPVEVNSYVTVIGEAVKYNAAIQTINPAPVYTAEAAQPGSNGAKGEKAVERYRTDKVNARHKAEANVRNSSGLSTTQGVGGGGGGPQ